MGKRKNKNTGGSGILRSADRLGSDHEDGGGGSEKKTAVGSRQEESSKGRFRTRNKVKRPGRREKLHLNSLCGTWGGHR